MSEPYLRCDMEARAGRLLISAKFLLAAPWTTLFGASGSGKTTLLRVLAGHVRPQPGRIVLGGGSVVFDGARGVDLPAHRRPFRTAAQHAWPLPGSVRDNLRYGIMRGSPPSREGEVVELFALNELVAQPMHTLSGGEAQRVSLARTVVAALAAREPVRLLLLDEPFTGLDLRLRDRLAPALRDFLAAQQLPVLSVTHDVVEAHLLGAEVLRMEAGRITSQGPAAEVLAPERASLLGILRTPGTAGS